MSTLLEPATPGSDAYLIGELRGALCVLAQGFLAFRRNALRPSRAVLQELYFSCAIVLLRLFVHATAESRAILPLTAGNAYVRFYSLQALVEQVLSGEAPRDPAGSTLWGRLRRLWQVLAEGRPDLAVPAFEGPLFAASSFPFLERVRLGDEAVYQVLQRLANVAPVAGEAGASSGRAASQFAQLYGTLLDYEFHFATGPTVVHQEVNGPRLLSGEGAAPEGIEFMSMMIDPGSVYLLSRPDAVVDPSSLAHAGEHAIAKSLDPLFRDVGVSFTKQRLSPGAAQDAVAAILSLRIVDPAMAAGRSLLNVADHLAKKLASISPEPERPAGLTALAYWRRECFTRCLFGISTDPLAVQLARISLRLASNRLFADDTDQRLQRGNALLGVRLPELFSALEGHAGRRTKRSADEQLPIWPEITGWPANELHEQVTADLQDYRLLADVWVAGQLGMPMEQEEWRGLANYLLHDGLLMPRFTRILQTTRQMAQQAGFFHPELSLWQFMSTLDWQAPQFLGDPAQVRRLLARSGDQAVPARKRELAGMSAKE